MQVSRVGGGSGKRVIVSNCAAEIEVKVDKPGFVVSDDWQKGHIICENQKLL